MPQMLSGAWSSQSNSLSFPLLNELEEKNIQRCEIGLGMMMPDQRRWVGSCHCQVFLQLRETSFNQEKFHLMERSLLSWENIPHWRKRVMGSSLEGENHRFQPYEHVCNWQTGSALNFVIKNAHCQKKN